MSIKVSSPTPVKKMLAQSDPDGDSWVMIRPITYRDDIMRGELLKQREILNDTMGRALTRNINMYRLRAEELWLTYDNARIVLVDDDGSETEPFKPRDEMTKSEFLDILAGLPSAVVIDWYTRMLEVNPDWSLPF